MPLADDYFQANMALLQEYHPDTWQAVVDYPDEPLGEIRVAEDGKPNLLIHRADGVEIFLHDNSSPEAELPRYFGMVSESARGVVFFVGMGLGYSPLAIIKNRPQIHHLAVMEPTTGIFIQSLHALDLSPLLSDRRVTIFIGDAIDINTALNPMNRALQLEDTHILTHSPSFQFSMETYQTLHDEIFKYANSLNIRGATTSTFGWKFIDNRLRHLSAIHHQRLLEHLKDAFAGVPAIIVAGGPSLNKNIALLPQAKGKAVIIAADTVVPALLAHGITPDFATSIDMQDITLEKIIDVSAKLGETSLVCSSWVSPMVSKNLPVRQVYWSYAAKHIEKWINGLLGGKLLTGGAGTVAHLSFTTAYLLGCSPIIFVGQDLAFTNNQDHALHTALTTKGELELFHKKDEILWVEGYGGAKVPTTRAWLSDKHYFEQNMAKDDSRKFVNATEGGLHLDGTEEMALQEAITRYCQADIALTSTLTEAERHGKMASRKRVSEEFGRTLKAIAAIETDLDRLEVVSARLEGALGKLSDHGPGYRTFADLPHDLRRQINELDTLNGRLDKAKVWELLDEITMEGLRQSERLNHEIKQLADQPERYLEWLKKSIQRFVAISHCRRQVVAPFKQLLLRLKGHLQQENFLIKKFDSTKSTRQEVFMEWLRLCFANGDHALMEKLITAHCSEAPDSAELLYYLGVIAAFQSQYDKADNFFARALTKDPTFAEQITTCRHQLADQYLHFSREWQVNDQDVARRMLFKGVRHSADHPEVQEALCTQVETLLIEATSAAENEALADMVERLTVWARELCANANLGTAIGHDKAAALLRFHGHALIATQEPSRAAESFAQAIAFAPQNPDLLLLHADACFAANDQAGGTASLDRAVSLDRNFARFWENMGDNLFSTNRASEALAAYEKCFMALPKHFIVLKKMGDCYMVMAQNEAAAAAYTIYQEKTSAGEQ